MLLWQKCLNGDLPEGSGLAKLVAANDVVLSKPGCADKSGVGGAANFFETKVLRLSYYVCICPYIQGV